MQTLRLSALALLLLLTCVSCRRSEGPEAEIRQVIEEMEEAAEAGDIGGIMEHLTDDYSDGDSNDKASLRGMLFIQLQRSGSVNVTKRIDTIEITEAGDEADVVVYAGLSDGPLTAGSTRADVFRFDLVFRLDSRDWVVYRAARSSANLGSLLGG
ncbi:MAG: ketosteroid isomerase-like protein [Bradymonadia bacterium]|jgi:ketosteroid isomerase-like protein